MKFIFWCVVIFVLILFCPIPLKITLQYMDGIFILKLFNKTLIPSKKKKIKNKKAKATKDFAEIPKEKKASKFKISDGIDIVNFLRNTKVKFTLRTKYELEYSIEDAAINALVYGLLHQLNAILYTLLKSFFKVKRFDPLIKTKYNDNYFNIKISSIIMLNLAKIIYIILFIYYQYMKKREPSTYEASTLKEEF